MPKEKIVVISQDYDGCYDINTPEFVESQLDLQVKKFQKEGKLLKPELVKAWKDKYRDYYKKMTGAPRAALQKYYSEITRDADKVKVYVGSDRQSHYIDQLNETKKNNGSVFPALIALCEAQNALEKSERWEFEPLLMADPKVKGKTHARHSGVAFLKIATKAPRRSQLNLDPKEQIPYINGKGKKVFSKRPMLLAQMWDAYYQNPKSEIDMIFKDDRADLIEDIIKNLKPTDMPPNVSLELVEFDYTAAPKKMFKTHKTILSSARMIEAFEKLKPDMQSKSRRVDALIDSMQWAANAKFDKSIQSRTKLNPSLDAILSTNQLRRLKRSASLKLKETTGERVEGDSVSAKARGHRFLAELEMANNSKAASCRTLLSIAK